MQIDSNTETPYAQVMPEIDLFQVDSFASSPFKGNPAAVCLLDAPAEPDWMQQVAAEMNLSETAFVSRRTQDSSWDLRFFAPLAEVDLCGHATLAAAHVLWETQLLSLEENAVFHTKHDELIATSLAQKREIKLVFPLTPVEPVAEALCYQEAIVHPVRFAGKSCFDYLFEIDSATALRDLKPDRAKLAELDCRGVIVTARSDRAAYDVESRFFAPRLGIEEDPVTGSAHCAIGSYWKEKIGQSDLLGHQASKRGGDLRLSVGEDTVDIFCQAVTVVKGQLFT